MMATVDVIALCALALLTGLCLGVLLMLPALDRAMRERDEAGEPQVPAPRPRRVVQLHVVRARQGATGGDDAA
jgi:hypothetical protein